ncbi:MAG: hypothetical protein VKJ04_05115 [Vampirovibrionales bacterium]|nr:hypothetical protein [Vampirovibrionales bacterium]
MPQDGFIHGHKNIDAPDFQSSFQTPQASSEKWRVIPYTGTQDAKRYEAKLISTYAMVVFTGLILVSGALVMFSDELPMWVSRVIQPDQQALASSLSDLTPADDNPVHMAVVQAKQR